MWFFGRQKCKKCEELKRIVWQRDGKIITLEKMINDKKVEITSLENRILNRPAPGSKLLDVTHSPGMDPLTAGVIGYLIGSHTDHTAHDDGPAKLQGAGGEFGGGGASASYESSESSDDSSDTSCSSESSSGGGSDD